MRLGYSLQVDLLESYLFFFFTRVDEGAFHVEMWKWVSKSKVDLKGVAKAIVKVGILKMGFVGGNLFSSPYNWSGSGFSHPLIEVMGL